MSENNEKMEGMEDLDKMFEELDSIEGSMSEDNSDSRDPITEVSKIGKATLENLTKPEEVLKSVSETISKSLPNPVQDEINKAKELHEQVLEPIADGLNKARKTSSNVVNAIADILPEVPGVTSTLRKIADAIKPEDNSSSSTSQPSEDEVIKNNLLEVFGEKKAEDRVKEKVEEIQNLSQLELTVRNTKNLEVIKDYLLTDHYNYLRKSLELQFKQTLALIDLRNRFGVFHKEHIDLLKAVVKNTGLPDLVKMENKEILEHKIKDKIFSKGISLFTENNFIKKLKEGLTDTILNKIESVTSNIDNSSEMLRSVSELSEQLTPGMRREMAGSLIASFLVGTVTNKIFNKVKKSEKGNKFFGSTGKTLQKTLRDPTKLLDKILPTKLKESGLYEEFKSILRFAKEESKLESIDLKETNLDQPVPFDLQTKKSITTVIPGLLSKIVAEVRALRTGRYDKDSELIFDYSKNKFVERRQLKRELVSELKDIKHNFTESTRSVSASILYYLLGNNYTPRDVEAFKRGLEHMIMEGKSLDIYDWYEDRSILKYFKSNVRSKIEKGIKKLIESKDVDSIRIISNIDRYLKSLKSQTTLTSEKLDIIKNAGLMEDLEELNILEKDSTTISSKKIRELLTKDLDIEKQGLNNVKKVSKYKIPKPKNDTVNDNVTKDKMFTVTSISNKLESRLSSVVKLLSDIKEFVKQNVKNKACNICDFLKELPSINKHITTINNTLRNIGTKISKSLTKLKKSNKVIDTELVEDKPKITLPLIQDKKTSNLPIISNTPMVRTITVNNATLNINNATITGLNTVLTEMSKSITKIIDANIGKKLVDKLNQTYENITNKSLEEYKQLLYLKLTDTKNIALDKMFKISDTIKETEFTKKIFDKINEFKNNDTVTSIKDKIAKQISKVKSSSAYKTLHEKFSSGVISLETYIKEKFKDRLVVVEEPDENGNIDKSYLIEFGKHTLVIPALALSSPKLLFETIKLQVGKEKALEIFEELIPSKEDIKNKITKTGKNVWSFITGAKDKIKEKGVFNILKEGKDKVTSFIKDKTKDKDINKILEKLDITDKIKDKLDDIDIYDKLPDSIKQIITKDENGDYIVTINDEVFKVNKEGLIKLLPVIKEKIENGTLKLKDAGLSKFNKIKEKIQQSGIGGALLDVISDVRKSITEILKNHKDIPEELLKQMFGGKNPLKDNVSIMDMVKAFTFGTFKSSFWFGRNVLRPGYKKMLSGVGQLAHNTAVTILTKVFGFDPKVAESVVGLMEAPFKIVGKAIGGVNTVLKKTKEAFQGLFSIVGKLGRLFLSKTWGLVKKGLGFLTGRSEDEIEAGMALYKDKVKQTGKKAYNSWLNVENKNILTKMLMSPIRHITKTGISLPGSVFKLGKGLANTFIITDKEEQNLWLNRGLKNIQNGITNVKENVKGNIRKFVDRDGRVTVETGVMSDENKTNKQEETSTKKTKKLVNLINELRDRVANGSLPKSISKRVLDILDISEDKIASMKDSSKDRLIKILQSNLKPDSTKEREEKIEKLRDDLEKNKEEGSLVKHSKTNFKLFGILGTITGILKNMFSGITNIGKFFFKWVPKLFTGLQGLGKFIVGGLSKTISGLTGVLMKGVSTVTHAGSTVAKHIKNKITGTKEVIEDSKEKSLLGRIWDKTKSVVSKTWNTVKNVTRKVFTSAAEIVKRPWQSVKEAVSHLVKTPFVKNLVGKIKKVIPLIRETLFKKLGKKEASKILAKVGSKLVPGVGTALLLWDAGNIAWDILHNHTPFLSAVSKQLIGIDLFEDNKENLAETIKKDNEKINNKANELVNNNKIVTKDKPINPVTTDKDELVRTMKKANIKPTKPTPVIVNNHIDDKHTKTLQQLQSNLVELNIRQVDLQTEINENLKLLTEIFVNRFGDKKDKKKIIKRTNKNKSYKPIPEHLPKPAVTAYSTDL